MKKKINTKAKTPGQYLLECRTQKKMSQLTLASHLGLTTQSISAFERDMAPIPSKRLKELVAVLGLDGPTMGKLMAMRYLKRLLSALR